MNKNFEAFRSWANIKFFPQTDTKNQSSVAPTEFQAGYLECSSNNFHLTLDQIILSQYVEMCVVSLTCDQSTMEQ